jgi:hypothetical protein
MGVLHAQGVSKQKKNDAFNEGDRCKSGGANGGKEKHKRPFFIPESLLGRAHINLPSPHGKTHILMSRLKVIIKHT